MRVESLGASLERRVMIQAGGMNRVQMSLVEMSIDSWQLRFAEQFKLPCKIEYKVPKSLFNVRKHLVPEDEEVRQTTDGIQWGPDFNFRKLQPLKSKLAKRRHQQLESGGGGKL